LLSKLIAGFCRGEIDGDNAKTLCYLLVSWVNIARDSDLEQRIEKLEQSQGGSSDETN
jgi:hypothetical protein